VLLVHRTTAPLPTTFQDVEDQQVGLDELGAWIVRCKAETPTLAEVSDDDLRKHYTVMLIVRMLVFSHEPAAGEGPNRVVDGLIHQLEPCLDSAHAEATRRGWEPKALREAARQVLSPPQGSSIDPVAIFRAG
jgi:hypothetical protein